MVSAIGGSTGLAQSMLAQIGERKAAEASSVTAATAVDPQVAETSVPTVLSAQGDAAARVGDALEAQFDAGRVQRVQDEPAAVDAGDAYSGEDGETDGTSAASAPTGGGARAAGVPSSESESADYIAEADTNNDRKVSEEERIAYAKKQASETEKKSVWPEAPERSREEEVQRAYLPQERSGSQLDVSA